MVARAVRSLVAVVAVLGLTWAGETPVTGRLDAVTVYRHQAAVTRVVPVPARSGAMEVAVAGLPERVVQESLYADGGPGIQIRAVRYRERTVHAAPPEGARELDAKLGAKLDELDAQLRELAQRRDVLTRKQGFLDKLGAFSAAEGREDFERGRVATDELSKLTSFVFEQHDQLAEKLLALTEQEKALTAQRDLVRRQRAELTAGPSHTEREAVVFIEKQDRKDAEIRLGYLVQGVDWRPSYNLRAASGKREVQLEYNASIHQMSGEDWAGVRLTLSTASPTLSADPPSLAPFRVTLDTAAETRADHDVVRVERERRAAEEQFRAAASAETREQAEAVANTAAARLNVLYLHGGPRVEEIVPADAADGATAAVAVCYPLDGRHSLASRADVQTLRIAALDLKADVYRLAQPTLTRHVYRQAQMTNASEHVLLPGGVNAYLDDRFAGTGTIPLVRPGQRFTAGLGADPRLTASQHLLSRDESVKGGNRELTLGYEILLENFSSRPIPLRVLDRIPMPAEGKIYVSLLKTSVPLSQDKAYVRNDKPRHVLRWDVEVPAGATELGAFSIEYQFSVGFAKNLAIRAGRTIAPLFALARPLEPWRVAEDWSKDKTAISLLTGKPGEPDRIALNLTRGREGKNAIGRRVEGDLRGYRWVVVDLDNRITAGTRVALGISAGKGWAYYESTPNFVQEGENPNVVFDLTAPNYKTETKGWQYAVRPDSLDDVRALYLVFYPVASGQVVLRGIHLAK